MDPLFVTGAGGFIGGSLLKSGLLEDVRVRAVLGPDDQRPDSACPSVEWLRLDLRQPERLDEALGGAVTVVHLAGPASVAASFERPREYLETHVLGTQAVVHACARSHVRRFVHVSSAEVYGQPADASVSEQASFSPRSPYAAAKAAAEMVVHAVSRSLPHVTFVILRPFLIYGPGMRTGGVVHSVLRQAQVEDRIALMDPTAVRDFCFVGDVARAIVLACRVELKPPLSIFNVGTGQGVSIRDLADAALAAVGRDVKVVATKIRDRPQRADVHRLVADAGRSAAVLGWRAKVPLVRGLQTTNEADPTFRRPVRV